MDIRPCHTLYINNLNDKVKKDELKRSLFELFSQFGRILDIVAMKTPSSRGQAFIAFREISSANLAIRALNDFTFYGKPMRVQYAKRETEAIARLKNISIEKPKRKADDVEQDKPKKKTKLTMGLPPTIPNGQVEKPIEVPAAYEIGEDHTHNILFLSNLPQETTDVMLSMLFSQHPGFREIRLIPGRADIAFVEFENSLQAGQAKDSLNGFKMTPNHAMQVTYANK